MRRQCFRVLAGLGAFLALAHVAIAAELELHHPDFHARLGMKVYVVVGDTAGAAGLKATLTGPGGAKVILDKKDNLAREEIVAINFRELPKGKYALKVELLDSAGKALKEAVREWEKPYDGIPRVGIDENNAVRVAGKLFFPMATWGVGAKEQEIDEWDKQANTLAGYTFSDAEATLDGWKKVLDTAGKRGKMVMGPFYGHYWPNGASRRYFKKDGNDVRDREINLDALAEYVQATKDHPALLMWDWLDEPELANDVDCIPPAEVRRWTEKCHEIDPQHPVATGNGGDGFRRPADNWMHKHRIKFTYLHNGIPSPRKVLLADVIAQDIYPVFGAALEKAKTSSSRPGVKEGWGLDSIENMCVSMDRMREYNRNLAPFMSAVRTAAFKDVATHPAPTASELRVVVWANILHGAKAILWFHYFGPTPEETKAEMARLLDQVTRLAPAVLGPDYTGSSVVKAGGRVDIMAKQAEGDDKTVCLFAVNIKESPDKATFTLDFAPKTIVVVDESRQIQPDGKGFADDFEPLAVHIYKVSR